MASGRHDKDKIRRIVTLMRREPDLDTQAIIERFGVSDSFIGKIRKQYKIPAPPRNGTYY